MTDAPNGRDERVETFRRLLKTTRWSSVSPQGKGVAFDILKLILADDPTNRVVVVEMAEALNLSTDEVEYLVTLPNEAIVARFSQPIRYERDWLSTYLDYTANHEAPEIFHFWVGCSVVSAATRRRVWFDQNYYRIYPNLFVVLVAPAGRCRRSVATNIGIRLLRAANVTRVLSEKITPEGLAVALHNVGEGGKAVAGLHIHAPELSVFLGRQQYNEGLIALLTTLYDCPDKWEYVTRTKSEIHLERVYLTLLGATAPDWLADSIPPVAFGGGFLSRTIMVAADSTDRVFPFPMPQDTTLEQQLVDRLHVISDKSGPFEFTPAARTWYEDWYRQNRQRPLDGTAISGYFERKQDHLIRLATILTLSQDVDLKYTPETLQRALDALEKMEPSLPLAFKHIGATRDAKTHELILWHLRRHGGACTQVQLLHAFVGRLAKRDLDAAMEFLVAAKLVEMNHDTNEWTLTDRGWTGT